MIQQDVGTDDIARLVPWLKRQNAQGSDIYARPSKDESHSLVLVDDLRAPMVERMKKDRVTPALVIETSPGNFQAWVKLSEASVDSEVRKRAAKVLAQAYGGDPGSVEAGHYGRLGGFTNRKPKHERDGRFPYVLIHEASGMVAPRGPELVAGVEHELRVEETQKRIDRILEGPDSRYSQADPVQEYRRQAKILMDRYGKDIDYSRMDWMIALDMSKSGRYSRDGIKRAMLECSPGLGTERHVGKVDHYIGHTVERAWEQVQRERGQDRGL
jgi:hypothetical protein